eukprot:4910149-Pyramimonas_sp.AAC.1
MVSPAQDRLNGVLHDICSSPQRQGDDYELGPLASPSSNRGPERLGVPALWQPAQPRPAALEGAPIR